MATIHNFQDLDCWKAARAYSKRVYQVIKSTSLNFDKPLANQLNGSSGSVMDNIAEGFGRDGNKEFINFLSIAKASLEESRSQLFRALDREHITNEAFEELYKLSQECRQLIGGFMTYLRKSEYKGMKYETQEPESIYSILGDFEERRYL